MNITINDIELEFDALEFENAKLFEEASNKVMAVANKMQKAKNITFSGAIKTQCEAIFIFLDTIFGKDTHKKIFGESVHLGRCAEVFKQIYEEIVEETKNDLSC